MDSILTFLSLIALATLAAMTYILAKRKNVALFITVGQDVFRWCTALLATVFVTRIGTTFDFIANNLAKPINSIAFIGVVIGITYSVVKHGKR